MVSSLAPAASLQGDAEETALIARAGALARQGAKSRGQNEPGPYIGLSYYKVLDGQEGGEPTRNLHAKRSAKIRRQGSRAGRAHIWKAERGGSGFRKPNRDVVQAGAVSRHAQSVTVDLVTGAHGKERESVTQGASGASVWGTVSEFVTDGLELLSGSDSSDSGDSDDLAAVNSFVLVGPSGVLILKYNKTHPVPIVEDEVVPGESGLAVAETGLGTVSAAVCFDFRFPELLRQAGQKRRALQISPPFLERGRFMLILRLEQCPFPSSSYFCYRHSVCCKANLEGVTSDGGDPLHAPERYEVVCGSRKVCLESML
jgi:hypothetical protein